MRDLAKAPTSNEGRFWWYVVLVAFVLVTRVPLIGNFEGEADTSRFVIGTHLWVIGDHSNQLVFARQISSGYYWFASHLAKATNSSPQNYALMLNIVSLCATLLMIPSLYELSRYIAGGRCAFFCALLFLISPAVWWLGIEPHPQSLSISLILLSLWAFVRGVVISTSVRWTALSAFTLLLSLLVRGDAVLMFPAFLSFLLFLRPWNRETGVAILRTAGILAITSIVYLFARASILDTGLLGQQLHVFQLNVPSGIMIVKQAAPIVMALGPILFLFCVLGLVVLTSKHGRDELSRWLILLAGWFVPGFLFYSLFPENLPRHVAIYTLALIWVGVVGAARLFDRKFAAIAVAVAAVNFISVPANSNNTFLLSPNVPVSAQSLRTRQREIRTLAEEAVNRGGTGCFVGTYTIPYFIEYALQAKNSLQPVMGARGHTSWIKSDRYSILCQDVNPQPKIDMPCSPAYSVEFAPDGSKHRFFGKEVYSSPIWAKLTVAASGSR